MIYIIGCGGVGTWLAPLMVRLGQGAQNLVVADGDIFEPKNLDRQFFHPDQMGANKAEALAKLYGCKAEPQYFDRNFPHELDDIDVLMVCVDNHVARNECIEACDRFGCMAILGGNETYSAEAFIYGRNWRGTALDPRIYYPEITTDKTGDPIHVAMGCIAKQQDNPQLASANFMAAAQMAHLFTVWRLTPVKERLKDYMYYPYLISQTLTKSTEKRVGATVETVLYPT